MELKDIKTLGEVAREYNISLQTLHSRLKNLTENIDYRKIEGLRQPIILTPTGIKKLVKGCSSYIVLRGEE